MSEIKLNGWTPEPWKVKEHLYRTPRDVLKDYSIEHNGAQIMTGAKLNADRIVACVNACKGMADPKAEIAALRDTLEQIGRSACLRQFNRDKCICFSCMARAALAGTQPYSYADARLHERLATKPA